MSALRVIDGCRHRSHRDVREIRPPHSRRSKASPQFRGLASPLTGVSIFESLSESELCPSTRGGTRYAKRGAARLLFLWHDEFVSHHQTRVSENIARTTFPFAFLFFAKEKCATHADVVCAKRIFSILRVSSDNLDRRGTPGRLAAGYS